jgi:hypothetical protein
MPARNVITRTGLGRAALGVIGAGVLAVGGAGFLTSSSASTDPTCAQPSSGTAGAAPAASDTGTGSPGAVPAASPSIGSLAAGALSNLPSGAGLPGVPVPGAPIATPGAPQDALGQLVAQLDALLAGVPGALGGNPLAGLPVGGLPVGGLPVGGLPVGGLPLGGAPGGGTGGSQLFVGATGSSGQTGVTVTPDPTPQGSQVGLVGAPGISGPVANLGL